jgi:hypothetical protein
MACETASPPAVIAGSIVPLMGTATNRDRHSPDSLHTRATMGRIARRSANVPKSRLWSSSARVRRPWGLETGDRVGVSAQWLVGGVARAILALRSRTS